MTSTRRCRTDAAHHLLSRDTASHQLVDLGHVQRQPERIPAYVVVNQWDDCLAPELVHPYLNHVVARSPLPTTPEIQVQHLCLIALAHERLKVVDPPLHILIGHMYSPWYGSDSLEKRGN